MDELLKMLGKLTENGGLDGLLGAQSGESGNGLSSIISLLPMLSSVLGSKANTTSLSTKSLSEELDALLKASV